MDHAQLTDLFTRRLGEHLHATTWEYETYTMAVDAEGYVEAARLCRDERLLACDFFDSTFGVDRGEDGFDVVTILYSTTHHHRVLLAHRCAGGRETPVAPTLTHLYPGANWMERETWDMFGIEFDGHPGLAPRILCIENFEGWPLRKDFYLASRAAKPWPGVKEPAETDEAGNVIEYVPGPGDAPGPMALDKAMAEQAKLANPEPEPGPAEGHVTTVGAGDDERVVESSIERVREDVEDAATTAKHRAEEQRKAKAEARARKAAERAEGAEGAGGEVEAGTIDQETYDRLIAEGKSERIARSKAKAAYVKKARAAQQAATADQEVPEVPSARASEDRGAETDGDEGGES